MMLPSKLGSGSMEGRSGSCVKLLGGIAAILLAGVLVIHLLAALPPPPGADLSSHRVAAQAGQERTCPPKSVPIVASHETGEDILDWDGSDELLWERFRWFYLRRNGRDPPAVLKRLSWWGKSGAAKCPDFASHR